MSSEIGCKIVAIRAMSCEELEEQGWDSPRHGGFVTVLELDNGTILFPSSDDEGNEPGAMFAVDNDGNNYTLYVEKGSG